MSLPTASTPGAGAGAGRPARPDPASLNPGGVAYLSFNALPGWHMRGMLREMLLFHVRALVAALQRLAAAREFLVFWTPASAVCRLLSAEYLRHEPAAPQAGTGQLPVPRVPGNGERTGAVQRLRRRCAAGRTALPVQRGAALPVFGLARRRQTEQALASYSPTCWRASNTWIFCSTATFTRRCW